MDFIKRSIFSKSKKQIVFELWNNEYPEKLSYKSIEEFDNYLKNLNDQSHMLLIDPSKKLMVGILNLEEKMKNGLENNIRLKYSRKWFWN
jgi:hypothetical protein